MAQIGKDYYEDLTTARLSEIIDELAAGRVPTPGPQNGRFAAEPLKGLTSLRDYDSGKTKYNASAQLAMDIGDTVKRIDGTEVPLLTPWVKDAKAPSPKAKGPKTESPKPAANKPADGTGVTKQQAVAKSKAKPTGKSNPDTAKETKPKTLSSPRAAGADDLKLISGVGPKLEGVLNDLGFWHFDQIAKWTEAEIAWVDSRLKFKGRIVRDDWMAQAAALAKAD
jgi:NADH-quinone oxidoreductase subunit E